jgi:hypothetical protein
MFIFPLAAIYEMIIDSSSHNLFPLELILYTFLTIPSIIGAFTTHCIILILLKIKLMFLCANSFEFYRK